MAATEPIREEPKTSGRRKALITLAIGAFLLLAILVAQASFNLKFISPDSNDQLLFFAGLTGLIFSAFVALTLVLGVTLPVFRQIRAKWLVRSSHQVAKYSYGIYLAHPFCITFALALLHRYNLAIRIGGILFSLAIVVVVLYHAIEKPFIDFGSRLAAKREQRGVGARPVAG